MTYSKTYTVNVYAVNKCGLSYTPATLTFTTKNAPSAPLVANPPVNVKLIAANITFTWTGIGTSEDETGGYPVTGYQLVSSPAPFSKISVYSVIASTSTASLTST